MALDEAGVQLIASGVASYISDINKADNTTTGFYKTLGSSDKSAGAFQEVITGALRHVGVALVEFAAQGAKAIGGFVKDSIGLAGEFESGMLDFQVAAGKKVDTEGLEEFRDLFIDIGKRLPVSTSDVQAAALEMVKGGIDPAIIAAGGLERNIQFASAAMKGDLVKAAEISSKVLGGWSDANATAEEKTNFLTMATDMMTKAANASATDVEGLSRGIFNAQGIAKTAGVGFGDLTTTLALLAPRFASSSEAGNSLKNMIARLQPTTDPAREAMASLGLFTEETGSAFYDAAGNFVGFEQASGMLQQSLAGLTKEQQASLLQTIFGNDAMGAAAALADGGAAAYRNMAEDMTMANGVAEAAALKQQGFETSLDNAKGSVEALQITIGSFLLPVLSDLLDNHIAPAVNALTDLASALIGDEEAFNKLSPAMKDVATAIEGFIDNVSAGIGIVQDIAGEIQGLIAEFNKGGQASAALEDKVEDLNGVWTTALGVIENVLGGYKAVAMAVLPVIQEFIAQHGDEIAAFFQTTWDQIIEIVTLALQVYDAIVPPILNTIAEFINDHGSEIQKILSGAWNLITSIITGALETIKGVFKIALALLNGDWEGAWQALFDVGKAQITAIQGAITGFLDMIAGIFDTSMSDIFKVWEDNWNMMTDIMSKIDWAAAGQSVIDGIINGINDGASALYSALISLAKKAFDKFMEGIMSASPSKLFATAGQSIVQGIMQGIEGDWPQLTNLIGNISADLIDEMEDIGTAMNNALAEGFGATSSIDRQMAKNLDDIAKIEDAFTQKVVSQDLDTLLKKSQSLFTDPKAQADYFKMASGHEFELLKIRQQIADTTTDAEKERVDLHEQLALAVTDEEKERLKQLLAMNARAQEADINRLNQQLILISRAQDAELDQFYKRQEGATSPLQDVANQINEIIMALSGMDLTEDQIKVVDLLAGIYNKAAYPTQTPTNPAYTGATSYSSTTNLNMPIYTNNSPGALQSSMAIAGAALL